MTSHNLPSNCYASVNSAIKHMNSLTHIDGTIANLDDALSKARLPSSIRVFRALKTHGNYPSNVSYIENEGYTSTSPLYDTSFAKYDEFDIVMELYLPKGTKGIYITPLSDYDTVEQEVLLDTNEIYVTTVQPNTIDQNGKRKTHIKGLLLSKEREGYEEFAVNRENGWKKDR